MEFSFLDQNAVKLFPLTAGQNSIWIAQALDRESPAYSMGEFTEILGKLDSDAFERAVRCTVDETISLALAFIETADGPRQFFAPERPWTLAFVDFTSTPDPQETARAWMRNDLAIALDIHKGRPFRCALLRIGAQQHWFYAVNHHLVNDAMGARLVLRRISQRYRGLVQGIEASYSALTSISEMLARENAFRRSSRFARDREYCLQQLTGRPAASLAALKTDPENAVERADVLLDPKLDLESFGKSQNASAAAVIFAAVTAYVYRQTGETDLLIGLQTSTRLGRDMRSAVGPATNTTPLRVTLQPSATFADLVRLVALRMREALRRQQYRIEDLRLDLGLSPNEPFPFSGVVNFFPLDEPESFTDQPSRRYWLGNWRVDDILFAFHDGGAAGARRIHVVGNAANYSAPIVQLHCERFHHLLRISLLAPETSVDSLDRMDPSERRRVLIDFNSARGGEPSDSFVHRLFERHAREHPERPALRSGEVEWSYAQLNGEANRLARCLKENGVGPDAPVVICIERSVAMVLAILAVLKAGGAYVPIDPRQPSERIEWALRDTGARVVLTSPQLLAQMPESRVKIVTVDDQRLDFSRFSAADLEAAELALTPDHLAYVIYTSGSTGSPKGVMIEHRALTHRLLWMQRRYALSADDRVLQKTQFTFDASVWEVIWPLMVGARVVLANRSGDLDPEYLAQLIDDEGVTTVVFVPSLLTGFLHKASASRCTTLRRILCGGEELPATLAQQCMLLLPHAALFNLYGPTEAAIHVTHWTCARGQDLNRVPIGRPIDDVQVYILDARREPVAIGALGEIYLAGAGLARGYLNRRELDAELFVPCPFAGDPTARMYKTGDLGLWRPDGAIEYHGRNDHQVKIRGIRIELGEIETQLKYLPSVVDAAVVAERRPTGEQRLVAFFVADPHTYGEADPNAAATLRRQLSRRLPEHMIPNAFIRLDALPLTANGKLDRRALLDQAAAPAVETSPAAQAPSTPSELALAEIWRDLLGRDDFGRLDDFFDLGGHSLLATQMRSHIRSRFAVDTPLKVVFEARTLADLAKSVDQALADQSNRERHRIEPAALCEAYVLSHSQQRMWLNQSLDPESTAYNLVGAVALKGSLNVGALSRAFDELRRRHESLRSVFYDTPEGVRQRILPFSPEPLEASDLRPLKERAFTEAARAAEEDARKPFDLTTGPVMRTLLFRTGDDEHLLYLALHHISGDQWSLGIMGREISESYNALCEGRAPNLKPLPIQYRDYATWRRSDVEVKRAQVQLAYWKQKLDGLPALELPTDFSRPRLRTSSGAFLLVPLPMELLSRLERLGRREGATLFMTMLAAFALHLSRLTGQTDIAIGAPIANRTRSEFETLVGTFVNTLVMRIDLSGRLTFRELLDRVRRTALEAYSHQDASFDELVQLVARPRDDGRPPLTQVMFNMLNAPFFSGSLDRLASEQVFIDRGGAQFEISVSVDAQVLHAIVFEYNIELFRRGSIERFAAQYLQLLESVVEDATTPISRVNLLPPAEAKLLLETWNATQVQPAREATFIGMFEAQGAARPDAEALRFREDAISYRELDQRAEAVSRHLRARGVRPGVGVGVCLMRTPLLLAVLLGVQKAGGHYIPLDPTAPPKRLEYTLSDAGLSVLIADAAMGCKLSVGQEVVRLDPQALALPPPEAEERFEAAADDLAYIIYTSGSTGRPKGVRVTQRALTNFLDAMRRRPGMTEHDSLVAVTTISFDISGLEFYLPLSVGGRVVLAPTDVAADGKQLGELLRECRASVLQATPATWRMLLEAGWTGSQSLRAFCGGETLSADLANELLPRVSELWNLYGPTETTIWSTAARIGAKEPISIGAPINNTRVYIVDAEEQICPIGIVGEIWIAGDGVAQGYQNLPELTRERFQRDPFVAGANQRLYKTGDLGAWGEDGRLYHRGRSDNQLKIRGFRIESEEVETLLRGHPDIRDAVVAARDAGEDDMRLVGYLIAEAGALPPSSDLRAFLRESAPSYMAPSIFVEIDKFPLTQNGKLDRKALPNPFASQAGPTTTYDDPAPGAEQLIADVWRDVLKTELVGANDNFFELGGHSLLALRVAALVEMKTGWRIDPRTLYFQTLRQVAAAADSVDASGPEL